MGKVIAVASGKGGTGKTTSVSALASCLAALGYKTLCIDFDAGLGNLDLSLGMSDFAVMDFMDVISGRINLIDAYRESPQVPNLFFLSAPNDILIDESHRADLIAFFDRLRKIFDYCMVDAPSGIGTGFSLAHCNVDMSIVVTTGEFPAMRNAVRTAAILREMGVESLRLLVNRVRAISFKHIKTTVDDIIDTTGVQLLGIITEDKNVFRALHEGVPLVLYSKRKSVYGYLDAARRITGEDIPLRHYQ